jgi:hypothetical protein
VVCHVLLNAVKVNVVSDLDGAYGMLAMLMFDIKATESDCAYASA